MVKRLLIPLLAAIFAECAHAYDTSRLGRSATVVTDDGATIHFWRRGREGQDAPCLLFVPGFLIPGMIWEKQLGYFGEHYLTVAIDPRSQGESSKVSYGHYTERRAKDIRAVVDRLGRPKIILVGWSLAVAEVLSYAEQFQDERLLGLVLVDETLGYEVREGNAWNSIQFLRAWASEAQTNKVDWTTEFVRGMYRKPVSRAHVDAVIKSALAVPEDTFIALLVGSTGFNPSLESIRCPCLIVATSTTLAKPELKLQSQRLRSAKILEYKDAGHALFVDESDRFNRDLESFIRDCRPK